MPLAELDAWLAPYRALSAQEITQDDYTWLARLLRRHAHAQGVTHEVTIARYRDGDTTRCSRTRKVRRRVRRFAGGNRSGFASVNNGPPSRPTSLAP